MSSPGVEPGPRPSQGRVRFRHTPRTIVPPPGSRTRPGGFEDRRAFRHTRGGRRCMPLPGVEPGLRPSEGRVPSVTLQGRFTFRQGRRPDSNRHGPVYKQEPSIGHVGRTEWRVASGKRIFASSVLPLPFSHSPLEVSCAPGGIRTHDLLADNEASTPCCSARAVADVGWARPAEAGPTPSRTDAHPGSHMPESLMRLGLQGGQLLGRLPREGHPGPLALASQLGEEGEPGLSVPGLGPPQAVLRSRSASPLSVASFVL